MFVFLSKHRVAGSIRHQRRLSYNWAWGRSPSWNLFYGMEKPVYACRFETQWSGTHSWGFGWLRSAATVLAEAFGASVIVNQGGCLLSNQGADLAINYQLSTINYQDEDSTLRPQSVTAKASIAQGLLEECVCAHELMESRAHRGKIILIPAW